jgi:Domain of unknown function DUF29
MSHIKTKTRPATAYETDFHAWARDQAERLRAQRYNELDWENIAEEIESLGRSDKRSIASDLNVVLVHLIKWKYQAQRRKAGWRNSIREHRDRIERILEDSPSLARHPADRLPREYSKARSVALEDTRLPGDQIPETCPFTIEQVLDPGFWPEPDRS